jgi:hypothetical protein
MFRPANMALSCPAARTGWKRVQMSFSQLDTYEDRSMALKHDAQGF